MWANPSPDRPSDVIALTADSKEWGEGAKLAYQPNGRHAACPFAGTKILSWAMNLTWLENAQARGFDEVILLNERGEVAECTSANIFAAVGSQVWTPPLNSGCLPGITREVLLGEIHVPGIDIVEKALTPSDLEAADEVVVGSRAAGARVTLRENPLVIGKYFFRSLTTSRSSLSLAWPLVVVAVIAITKAGKRKMVPSDLIHSSVHHRHARH